MENKCTDFKHYTVMAHEAVDALNCRPGKIYVDATLGGGGHSELILQKIQPDGRLIAFDIDNDAISYASERLKDYKNLTIVKESYSNIKNVLQKLGIKEITGGIVFDLGTSYHQLTKQERGFSFMKEAPLDMRFNQDSDFSAYDVINGYSEEDLIHIISEYGEERFTKRIVKNILNYRKLKNIETTTELAEIIKNEYFDCNEFIYDRNTSLTKALIEIVGKETLLKSISLDDSSYLQDALVNNLIRKGRKKEEALEITNKFLEDIDRSFYDNELSEKEAKNIDLKQFYVYEDHDFESNYVFDILVDDFLKAYYPNNNHYYFNINDQKELVKY